MTESNDHPSKGSILGKSFWAALLLTGNTALAESAVRQAIDLWDCEEDYSEQLLYATVKVATTMPTNCNRDMQALVPAELCRVAELSSEHRSCFVLRVLLGLSSSTCAHILELTPSQVDQRSRDAVTSLSASKEFLAKGNICQNISTF